VKAPLTVKFSFGQVVVDPASNAIHLNGVEKRLEPKLVTLLCLFAAQGKVVISRQEITGAIWPDVVVGEESITRAIFALRNALGDDAKQPRYIETISKKGYRFLVDTHLVNESANLIDTTGAGNVARKRRPWFMYLSGLGLVLGLLVALMALGSRHEKPGMEIASILPLNKREGVERAISLNAEGTRLLFVHEHGQHKDLYSRDLQTSKDTLWAGDELKKQSPVWIDDNTIAYLRDEKQIVRHYQNQPAQVLYSSSKQILQLSGTTGDADNLFFLERQNNELVELKSLNLRNGKQQNWRDLIPQLPNKIGQIQHSMQSDTLLMVIYEAEQPKIVALDLLTKKITPVNNQFSEINKITPVSDHSLLVVGSLDTAEGIWLVDTQQPTQVVVRASGAETIVDVQIDTQRNVIFYANLQRNIDVKLVAVREQKAQALPELNSTGMDINAVFTDDGKSIYFISNRTGHYDIWRYDLESKSLQQISTLNALWISWFSLSHSEKNIAVGYRSDDLYLGIIDTTTGQLQHAVTTPTNRFPLAWSQDDKTIYVSEHQAEVNLFSYDKKTLTPSLFASKSGLYVKDLDGKSVIYVDYNRQALVERNLVTRHETILHDTIPTLLSMMPDKIRVNNTNDGFYAGCQIDWQDKICFYSLSATNSPPVAVSDIPYWQLFNITADGETMLVEDTKPSSGDIMKMQLRP
jgi:DNA-binding winged helix-turn-helix (wHTH) protein